MNLTNNTTGVIASAGKLGALSPAATLANAGLKTAITAVDGSGNGSFAINGVNINFNVNTSFLGEVITNINESSAGVTAAYDASNDRFTLTNNITGDSNITVSEAAGGFLGAMGMTSGPTLTRGTNAQYTLNGGPPRRCRFTSAQTRSASSGYTSARNESIRGCSSSAE